MLDNFRSHHANITLEFAERNQITLVFLPPYSPDLNPIEFIWKSIKRIISRTFIKDLEHLKQIIIDAFQKYGCSLSFAKAWIAKFLGNEFSIKIYVINYNQGKKNTIFKPFRNLYSI